MENAPPASDLIAPSTLTQGGSPLAAATPAGVPTGVILPYGGNSAPTDWLLCDGSAVSRTTYESLFSIIGTTYGSGDGTTTFNVPDLRGRVAVGLGTNTDVDALGESDGLSVASRSPVHNSSVNDPGHVHDIPYGGTNTPGSGALANVGQTGSSSTLIGSALTNISVGPGGSRPADRVAYLVTNYIIRS